MANKSGSPDFERVRNTDTTKATAARIARADEFALMIGAYLKATLVDAPSGSRQGTADWLNSNGYKTSQGAAWSAKTVTRLYMRLRLIADRKGLRY